MEATAIEPALLNEPAAMRYLDLGRTKFRELVRDREVRVLRIGKSVKFARADLDEFVDRLRAAEEA